MISEKIKELIIDTTFKDFDDSIFSVNDKNDITKIFVETLFAGKTLYERIDRFLELLKTHDFINCVDDDNIFDSIYVINNKSSRPQDFDGDTLSDLFSKNNDFNIIYVFNKEAISEKDMLNGFRTSKDRFTLQHYLDIYEDIQKSKIYTKVKEKSQQEFEDKINDVKKSISNKLGKSINNIDLSDISNQKVIFEQNMRIDAVKDTLIDKYKKDKINPDSLSIDDFKNKIFENDGNKKFINLADRIKSCINNLLNKDINDIDKNDNKSVRKFFDENKFLLDASVVKCDISNVILSEDDAIFGFHEINNKPFFGFFTSAYDLESEYPIFRCLYLEDNQVRMYTPINGNTYNKNINSALGRNTDFDTVFIQQELNNMNQIGDIDEKVIYKELKSLFN